MNGKEFKVTHGKNSDKEITVEPLTGKDNIRWKIERKKNQVLRFKTKESVMKHLNKRYKNVQIAE